MFAKGVIIKSVREGMWKRKDERMVSRFSHDASTF